MTITAATRPRRHPGRVVLDLDGAAIVLAFILALVVGSFVLQGPSFVDQVSIENPSEYDIGVRLSDENKRGWMVVTTTLHRSTSTTRYVVDVGDLWVFRFRSQGREGGELRMTRADLERAGWTVTIPDEVIQRLRDLGAPAPPS